MTVTLLLALAVHPLPAASDTSFRLVRGSSVEISTSHSAIIVRTGSDDMLVVRGGQAHGRGNVEVEADESHGRGSTPLEVTVPSWIRLDVSSHSGSLTFNGSPARLNAETVNGQISLKGGSGVASLESVAGAIIVTDFRGEKLSVDATAGDVVVNGATGAVELESINGAVRMRDMRTSEVQASSVNDVVEYSGTLDPRGNYDISSHNGGINLWLPADVSARMKISTFNGEFISPDIPATTTGWPDITRAVRGKDKGDKGAKGNKNTDGGDQEFTVTFGKGDASVSLDSFNGDITVRRLGVRQD